MCGDGEEGGSLNRKPKRTVAGHQINDFPGSPLNKAPCLA